jgi:hypothetical protein
LFSSLFVLAIIFGIKPILNAVQLSPIKALSQVHYFGLTSAKKLKPLTRFGLTLKIASRSFFRRQSASVRIIILLSIIFVLLTVSIAGGIIANSTSKSWIENAVGANVVAIAHKSMGIRYMQLLGKFSGAKENVDFTYIEPELAVPDRLLH